jgi:hypothetical protein
LVPTRYPRRARKKLAVVPPLSPEPESRNTESEELVEVAPAKQRAMPNSHCNATRLALHGLWHPKRHSVEHLVMSKLSAYRHRIFRAKLDLDADVLFFP